VELEAALVWTKTTEIFSESYEDADLVMLTFGTFKKMRAALQGGSNG
jgi:hypothetical protein